MKTSHVVLGRHSAQHLLLSAGRGARLSFTASRRPRRDTARGDIAASVAGASTKRLEVRVAGSGAGRFDGTPHCGVHMMSGRHRVDGPRSTTQYTVYTPRPPPVT